MDALLTLFVGTLALIATTAFHYEAISRIDARLRRTDAPIRRQVPLSVALIVGAHVLEIAFYAVVFAVAAGPLGLGTFVGMKAGTVHEYFYFAAEAYSSFGYGDIIPTGGLRIIASLEPLNGLLLLAWSGSFLYSAVHRRPFEDC